MAAESEILTTTLGGLSAPGSSSFLTKGTTVVTYMSGLKAPPFSGGTAKNARCIGVPCRLEELDLTLAARMAPRLLLRPGAPPSGAVMEPWWLKGTYVAVQWP